MWAQTVLVALALGDVAAFSPARQLNLRRSAANAVMDSEVATASESVDATSPVEEASSPAPAAAVPSEPLSGGSKVSKFKPRARELWDKNGGYGRYSDQADSEVYAIFQDSPLGAVSALAPLLEKTKARPRMLDGTHAGDSGFDPLGYCSSEELQYFYLESEVKHGRLAMVACAGWVGAELGGDPLHLAEGGRAPALLNGHLTDWQNFLPALALFTAWSYLEHQVYPAQYIEHTPNSGKHNYLHYMDGPYVAGNYEFDPLNLYASLGDSAVGRKAMRELEVQHGRAAMLGITSWVAFEALTGLPILAPAGCLFKPFWAWGLPFLGENGAIGTAEFAAVLGAGAFAAYSQVMEIDSMKYQGDGDPDFDFFDKEGAGYE